MHRAAADASVFHAIADPTRRAVLDLLREGERTVSGLLESVRSTQSALSQHLGVLKRSGLVSVRKSGRHRVYAIRPEPLAEVADWVTHYERFWTTQLDSLRAYLDRHHASKPVEKSPNDVENG